MQDLEAFSQQGLEIVDGSPFEEHVPVGASRFGGLDLWLLAVTTEGLSAASAFP